MSSGRHHYSSSSSRAQSSRHGQYSSGAQGSGNPGSNYKAPRPYTGYTSPEELARADKIYNDHAPSRDRAATRVNDAKAYRDQAVKDQRSNKTIKKANKSLDKWQDIYDDHNDAMAEPIETRGRARHENVVRKTTHSYGVPEEINQPISKYSHRSDRR